MSKDYIYELINIPVLMYFAGGSNEACINIALLDDILLEGNQNFFVAAESTNLGPNAVLIWPLSVEVVIQDNESMQYISYYLLD